jgi:hypothetical protein
MTASRKLAVDFHPLIWHNLAIPDRLMSHRMTMESLIALKETSRLISCLASEPELVQVGHRQAVEDPSGAAD